MTDIILSNSITSYLHSLDSKKVVIGFSWWPDSVSTYNIISDYYLSQWWDANDIYIAHYNHKFRSESDHEADYIKKNYHNVLYAEYQWDCFNERYLRIARHTFFKDCMYQIWSKTLILWHNLSDRLETTIMNIQRGAWTNGIANMQEVDEKEYLLDSKYTILRPILQYPKHYITTYCDNLWLQYFTDKTNSDPTISERNNIRTSLIKPLQEWNSGPLKKWREERSELMHKKYWNEYYCIKEFFSYRLDELDIWKNLLERYAMFYNNGTNKKSPIFIKSMQLATCCGYDYIFKCTNFFNEDDIIRLLKWINEYRNITKPYLSELLQFIQYNDNWHKEIGIWKLYICHDRIYLIKENNYFNAWQVLDFWLQYDDNVTRLVDLQTDIYNGKPVNKRFINNKIPVFLRHLVPVDSKGNYKDSLIIQLLHSSK